MKQKIILNASVSAEAETARFYRDNPNGKQTDVENLDKALKGFIPAVGRAVSLLRIPHAFKPSWGLNGKGDVKCLTRTLEYLTATVSGQPLRATARMVRPLTIWSAKQGFCPVKNGSFGAIATSPEFWQILVDCQNSDNWASKYFEGTAPNMSQISTIKRQLSLAKDIMYTMGMLTEKGAIVRNGIFNATLKGTK